MPVVIERVTADLESAKELYTFIRPMADEVAFAVVDDDKAFTEMCKVMDQGHCFTARDGGEIVGALGLIENDYWYAQANFLIDRWFYVRPDRRFGDVGVKLLRIGREEGRRLSLNVFVMVANPDRTPKQNAAAVYTQVAGYTPFVHLMRLYRAPIAGNA